MNKLLLLFLVICLFTVSCDTNIVFSQMTPIDGWKKTDTISFDIEHIDTLSYYNIYLILRNDQKYPYQNIFLITKFEFGNEKVITDTLEYEMAYPDGKWMGKGFGAVKESLLVYKEHLKFSSSVGNRFSIVHAVRKNNEEFGVESLQGINNLGIKVVIDDE